MTIFQACICITSSNWPRGDIKLGSVTLCWQQFFLPGYNQLWWALTTFFPTLTTHLWFLNEHCVIFYYLHMLNISNHHLTFMFPNNSWWHQCHCTCYLWERPRYWPVHEAVFEQQKSMVWWFTSDYWFSDLRILEPILENWPKSFKCVCNEW